MIIRNDIAPVEWMLLHLKTAKLDDTREMCCPALVIFNSFIIFLRKILVQKERKKEDGIGIKKEMK